MRSQVLLLVSGTGIKWAMSWENLFLPYANNKWRRSASDQHLCCSLPRSIITLVSISEISSLYLASVAEEASLCLTWSETRRQVFSWQGSNVICIVFNSEMGGEGPLKAKKSYKILMYGIRFYWVCSWTVRNIAMLFSCILMFCCRTFPLTKDNFK